jgi:DNA-binding transcriptional LysR family regulator
MDRITLAQLRCIEAVVAEGSLEAAATRIGRTHPAVAAAVRTLERQLGFPLFARGGYRLALTERGHAFLVRARGVVGAARALEGFARQLAQGEEPELRLVIGDLTPLPPTLALLRTHFSAFAATRLHLRFGALTGPWELLDRGDADLIFHHVEAGDARFESIPLLSVRLIPVAAPGFFPVPAEALKPDHLAQATQCVIRDTAEQGGTRSYHLVEGAHTCTVSDQLMKREVILQGLGWGHMPDFLVAEDLREGALLSLAGPLLRGSVGDIVAARRAGVAHGPVARALWQRLRDGVSATGAVGRGA